MNEEQNQTDHRASWTISDAIVALIWFLIISTAGELLVSKFLERFITSGSLIVSLFIGYIGLIGIIYYLIILERRSSWYEMGLKRFNVLSGLAMAISFFFLTKILTVIYAVGAEKLGIKESNPVAEQITQIFGKGTTGFILAIIVVGIIAPIVEELFFRGIFYGALHQKMKIGVAMLLSSLLFALFHFSLYMFIPILIIGFSLAYLYEKTGSLGPPIILHGLNNIVSVVGLYYYSALMK